MGRTIAVLFSTVRKKKKKKNTKAKLERKITQIINCKNVSVFVRAMCACGGNSLYILQWGVAASALDKPAFTYKV